MKRKMLSLMAMLLCFALFMTGCSMFGDEVGEDDLVVWASSTYWAARTK